MFFHSNNWQRFTFGQRHRQMFNGVIANRCVKRFARQGRAHFQTGEASRTRRRFTGFDQLFANAAPRKSWVYEKGTDAGGFGTRVDQIIFARFHLIAAIKRAPFAPTSSGRELTISLDREIGPISD